MKWPRSFLMTLAALILVPAIAYASTACVKPWSPPDRWDDVGRPGWFKWKGNGHWDSEKFTDQNGNGLYDVGEPFQDGIDTSNGAGPRDGQYTSEFYHPFLSGYVVSKDLGQLMTFKVASPHDASVPGQFYPIDLCFDGKCTGGEGYRWNIANCNPQVFGTDDWLTTLPGNLIGPTTQGVHDLIAQDPGAYWDAVCECVQGSAFEVGKSPRLVVVPMHDPRIPLQAGLMRVRVVKLVFCFLEDMSASGNVVGRFSRGIGIGGDSGESGGGSLYEDPVQTQPATWGRVKATYR